MFIKLLLVFIGHLVQSQAPIGTPLDDSMDKAWLIHKIGINFID